MKGQGGNVRMPHDNEFKEKHLIGYISVPKDCFGASWSLVDVA